MEILKNKTDITVFYKARKVSSVISSVIPQSVNLSNSAHIMNFVFIDTIH